MSRVLFVVPPLVGHVNPTVALGGELAERGHEVVWAGLPEVVGPLLPEGARLERVVGSMSAEDFARLQDAARGLRGAAALRFLWEDFLVPYARATAPELVALVDRWTPDVVVVDQQAVGGAAVARHRGLRWITSATTSAELTDPLAGLPKVDAWVRRQLVDLQLDLGVDPRVAATGDLRFSDELVLAFTSEALVGPDLEVPGGRDRVRFVGPSLGGRPDPAGEDWSWIEPDRPLVLASLGTVNAEVGERFFAVVVEALAGTDVQVVVVAPPALVRVPPGVDNVVVREWVPQLALLARADAVISHGGHNTVCEALSFGLPLVLAPVRDDQPIVADQVVRAGAGVRVRFGRVRAPELRDAVDVALASPDLRAAAGRVGASLLAAGGAVAAAEAVESILEVPVP